MTSIQDSSDEDEDEDDSYNEEINNSITEDSK